MALFSAPNLLLRSKKELYSKTPPTLIVEFFIIYIIFISLRLIYDVLFFIC